MEILIGIGVFLFTLILFELGYLVLRNLQHPEKREVLRRLRIFSSAEYEDETIDIIRKKLLSEVPWLNQVLLSIRWTEKIDRLLVQSGTAYTLGVFVLLSVLLVAGGFVVGSWVISSRLLLIPVALLLGMIPFFYIYSKKKKRMEKFQRQLPDALDLVSRALKAGHAFSAGLQMVADELGDPVGTEFEKALYEVNFGVGVSEALRNLSHRVDCPDLKFFIISVILQRETGGNLAEILGNISHLIRERFKLQGRIRVLSAEGRLSAGILIAIPFVIALALYVLNPGYVRTLLTDPIGKVLVLFAMIMMIVGIFVMKRMIEIKV
jgi:tight adherence protein B